MEDNKDIKPTPEQIKNYYEKGIEDGLTREQIADLFFADQVQAYNDVMGDLEKPDIPKKIKIPSALDDLPLDIDPRLDDWEYEFIDRPDGMSQSEFLKKNKVTDLQYNAVFAPENLPEGFEDRIVQRGGSWLNLITVKEGVTPDELRKAIELVAQKTPHQSVKEFIYSQYETFDNIKNKIPGPVAEKTLNNINKDIAAILFDYSNEVYDPKGGGMATDLYYRNKIDEGFMPIIDKGVDENVIEKAVLKEFIPDYGADQLPAPGWAEQRIGNALRMAQEDLTIEGEVVSDNLQLNKSTNILDEIEKQNNLPKGSFSKLGAILDPISEGLELALRAAGLGKIANWWIKAEAANFLAAIMRAGGAAQAQAGLAQSKILLGDVSDAKNTEKKMMENAAQSFASQMKLSPSMWLEQKYAQSSLGKGKTPTEQMYNKVVEALKLGGK